MNKLRLYLKLLWNLYFRRLLAYLVILAVYGIFIMVVLALLVIVFLIAL
jgi:hypothetical protein